MLSRLEKATEGLIHRLTTECCRSLRRPPGRNALRNCGTDVYDRAVNADDYRHPDRNPGFPSTAPQRAESAWAKQSPCGHVNFPLRQYPRGKTCGGAACCHSR